MNIYIYIYFLRFYLLDADSLAVNIGNTRSTRVIDRIFILVPWSGMK